MVKCQGKNGSCDVSRAAWAMHRTKDGATLCHDCYIAHLHERLHAMEACQADARVETIRQGLDDAQLPAYEEVTAWLERVPVTWLPALLSHVVKQCVRQDVFQAGKLVETVKRVVDREGGQ